MAAGRVPRFVTRARQRMSSHWHASSTREISALPAGTTNPRASRIDCRPCAGAATRDKARQHGSATAPPSRSLRDRINPRSWSVTVMLLAERAEAGGGVLGRQIALRRAEHFEADHELAHG